MTTSNLTTLYIVRHGESEANVKISAGKIAAYEDFSNSPLTQKGKLQAEILTEKLKDVHFDAVFSSDLLRAKQTAEILVLEKNLSVKTTQAIRERYMGTDEKKWHENLASIQEEIRTLAEKEKMNFKFEDAETQEEAVTRLITFTREIAVAYSEKTVLIVCHGTIMRSFLIKLGFATFDELPSGAIENTGYVILESDGTDFFIKETQGIHKKEN